MNLIVNGIFKKVFLCVCVCLEELLKFFALMNAAHFNCYAIFQNLNRKRVKVGKKRKKIYTHKNWLILLLSSVKKFFS